MSGPADGPKGSCKDAPNHANGTQAAWRLDGVVDALCEGRQRRAQHRPVPQREEVVEIIDALRAAMFPEYFAGAEAGPSGVRFNVGSLLDKALGRLHEQVRRGLCFTCDNEDPIRCARCHLRTHEIVEAFIERLPGVQKVLETDVRASYEGDPAATSPDEAIFCYPGLFAVTCQRLAHELHRLGVPLIPRMIVEYAHGKTGIDIHHGARIGESFFIDHGTGVVIGETCVIGARVRLYQGVTLGAKSFTLDGAGNLVKGIDRHPVVEDDVVIYSGATILGRVTIGRGSVIGGNVWLTRSVPPNSRVTQAQVRETVFESGAGI